MCAHKLQADHCDSPKLPQPPARAFADPTSGAVNMTEVQNWHGTNELRENPMMHLHSRHVCFKVARKAVTCVCTGQSGVKYQTDRPSITSQQCSKSLHWLYLHAEWQASNEHSPVIGVSQSTSVGIIGYESEAISSKRSHMTCITMSVADRSWHGNACLLSIHSSAANSSNLACMTNDRDISGVG